MAPITRRRFTGTVLGSAVGAAGGWLGRGVEPLRSDSPVVVLCRSTKLKRVENDIDTGTAAAFLDAAVARLTKKPAGGEAWGALFSPADRVGIKLSCLAGMPLSSSRGLTSAIVAGLKSAGVKENNIFIWERTDRELKRAGYAVGSRPVNVFGTDHLAGSGYSDRIEICRSVGTCFSRIVEFVDALISVPVLKEHDIAGVSIGMKNFYGAIHNPNKFHGNRCDPFVADLCSHPLIRGKLRLTVCDASRIQIHNGPAFFPRHAREYGGVLVGLDPVALDRTGWRIIEDERRRAGMPSLRDEGREPTYISSAQRLGLGCADRERIELVEMGERHG